MSRFSFAAPLPKPRPESITPLRRARLLSGIAQGCLARAIDRSPSWLCERELGHTTLPPKDAARLAKILRVPVGDLFAQDGDR
jgi:hypothetical protein